MVVGEEPDTLMGWWGRMVRPVGQPRGSCRCAHDRTTCGRWGRPSSHPLRTVRGGRGRSNSLGPEPSSVP